MTTIPRSSLRRVLAELEADGAVVGVGEGRARRYGLVSQASIPKQGAVPQTSVLDRQAAALAHLRRAGTLTRRAYVELTAVSPRTANRDLEELAQQGLIRSNGRRGRAATYVLP